LNRYSYVRNNPLNKTDLSGYAWTAAVATFVKWAVGTYVVVDFLVTIDAENVATLASAVTCVFGDLSQCAGASAGSSYAFTYDFGKAVRAAASVYAAPKLLGLASKTREAGVIVNAIANGVAGGILSEIGGGRFGDGFRAAGLSALAKPFIRQIGGGAESYKSTRIAVRAILGGTISELTGGKFANGAITGALAQAHNAETELAAERGFWDNPGANLPSFPQAVTDFSAGLGDAIFFGFGDDIRASLNIDGGINTDSQLYGAGEVASIAAGGIGVYRGVYVGSLKLVGSASNITVLNFTSTVRNTIKRYGGPALFSAAERAKIVPFATHVANKGFDSARAGLVRTRATYDNLIGLSPGIGGLFND
jgi:hypothetical protein